MTSAKDKDDNEFDGVAGGIQAPAEDDTKEEEPDEKASRSNKKNDKTKQQEAEADDENLGKKGKISSK